MSRKTETVTTIQAGRNCAIEDQSQHAPRGSVSALKYEISISAVLAVSSKPMQDLASLRAVASVKFLEFMECGAGTGLIVDLLAAYCCSGQRTGV